MQSGISVAEELQDAFQALLSSESTFALLVTIQRESLVSTATIPRTSDAFAANLASLTPHINRTTALYVILRRHATAPLLTLVTYVPDAAHVRQKTLFASTRLALVRELGSEHFRDVLFMTTPEEVTEKGFAAVEAHNGQAAPLTEEEQTLGEVRRAEMAAGAGTAYREIHLSKGLKMPVSVEAVAAMREIQAGTRTVAMLKIDPATESVELLPESPTPSTIADLRAAISAMEPRFTFFRYRHTARDGAGGAADPVLFIYTCPATPGNRSIKNRMLYPLMKRAVLAVAEDEAGLVLAKRFEVEDPGELTDEDVLGDLYPRGEVRQMFTRPKRPGR